MVAAGERDFIGNAIEANIETGMDFCKNLYRNLITSCARKSESLIFFIRRRMVTQEVIIGWFWK